MVRIVPVSDEEKLSRDRQITHYNDVVETTKRILDGSNFVFQCSNRDRLLRIYPKEITPLEGLITANRIMVFSNTRNISVHSSECIELAISLGDAYQEQLGHDYLIEREYLR